jgi:hypothetical protein
MSYTAADSYAINNDTSGPAGSRQIDNTALELEGSPYCDNALPTTANSVLYVDLQNTGATTFSIDLYLATGPFSKLISSGTGDIGTSLYCVMTEQNNSGVCGVIKMNAGLGTIVNDSNIDITYTLGTVEWRGSGCISNSNTSASGLNQNSGSGNVVITNDIEFYE